MKNRRGFQESQVLHKKFVRTGDISRLPIKMVLFDTLKLNAFIKINQLIKNRNQTNTATKDII